MACMHNLSLIQFRQIIQNPSGTGKKETPDRGDERRNKR